MRYWDTSALVPLLVDEASSSRLQLLHRTDPAITTWWGTLVECESALGRLGRAVTASAAPIQAARLRLAGLAADWVEIRPEEQVRRRAMRLLRTHPLRAADALQLAAALVAVSEDSAAIEFVCTDSGLATAAGREGFVVV